MKENMKTWLLAAGVVAVLAFAALGYHLYSGIIGHLGIDREEVGGIAVVTLILWLALRRQQPMTQRARRVLGVAVAVVVLLGAAVFFIS
jgi:sirohydrochlorin ferrochelatase